MPSVKPRVEKKKRENQYFTKRVTDALRKL